MSGTVVSLCINGIAFIDFMINPGSGSRAKIIQYPLIVGGWALGYGFVANDFFGGNQNNGRDSF